MHARREAIRKRAEIRETFDIFPAELEQEALIDAKTATREGYKLISPQLYKDLRAVYGARAIRFFHLYRVLRGIQLGRPVPPNLSTDFRDLVRIMANTKARADGRKISPPVKDQLFSSSKRILPKLDVVESAFQADPSKRGGTQTWRPITEQYGLLIEALARDKGVYLKIGKYIGAGGVQWPVFFKMRPEEEGMARLEDEDTPTFEAMQRLQKNVQELNDLAVSYIKEDGFIPEKRQIAGRWVNIAVSEETKLALDELRKRQASLSSVLRKTNKTWAKWWRSADTFDVDSEEYRAWLENNPEPEMMPKTKLKKLRERWERRKPKDGDPESLKVWEKAEPTMEGLKEEISKRGASYRALREEYDRNADETVYDHTGTRYSVQEFQEKETERRQQMTELASDTLIDDERIESMRLLSESTLDKIEGDSYTVSLTDDAAKSNRLTKIFPVKEVPARILNQLLPPDKQLFTGFKGQPHMVPVVTSGRYAGIPVDHLVNENGRMIERTEYIFDVQSGTGRGRPKKAADWELTSREPFVTVADDGRLFISVEGGKGSKWRKVADQLHAIAGFTRNEKGEMTFAKRDRLVGVPGFEKDGSYYTQAVDKNGEVKKRGQFGFYFTPENFGTVQEKIGAMALSEGAAKHLEDYFEDLLRAEKATEEQNLAPFHHSNLGGFRDWVLNADGEEWLKEKQNFENLQRQHPEDARVGEWARKAQVLRDKLNYPKTLLEKQRNLQSKIRDFPKSPNVPEWTKEVEEINQTFKRKDLGGFQFQLLELQKKSLAWMEARGDNGVCSLDTGIGKTLVALAMIQKLQRDGWTDSEMVISEAEAAKSLADFDSVKAALAANPGSETLQNQYQELKDSVAQEYPHGTNGRFLYVAPSKNLLGNLDKEAAGFLDSEGYSITGEKIDSIHAKGQGSFQSVMNKKPGQDTIKVQRGGGTGAITIENWKKEVTRYVAIFFDEAHEYITGSTGAAGKAYLGLKHPRKILLTASPMTNEPMDAYLLASVCNNNDLSDTRTPEGRKRRSDMREWKDRYCETVGGRVVGAKKGDPSVERDLRTWARTNLFFADKQKVKEGWARPPELRPDSERPGGGTRVLMDPEVESMSKEVASLAVDQLRALYQRFEDRGYLNSMKTIINPKTGEEEQVIVGVKEDKRKGVRDPDLEKFTKLTVRPIFDLLTMLSMAPEMATVPKIDNRVTGATRKKLESLFSKLFPGKNPGDRIFPDRTIADNPKFQEANAIVGQKLSKDIDTGTSRVLLWTDNAKLVEATAKELSKTQSGIHVAALANEIRFFRGGQEMEVYLHPGGRGEMDTEGRNKGIPKDGYRIPFGPKIYKLYRSKSRHPKNNPGMKQGEQFKWSQFVTSKFVQGNPNVRSMTCLGQAYQSGQNFQGFQTVIHLDRNHWNNENMKQRTARAYRQGQKEEVEEITLDSMYTTEAKPGDASLDELRRLQQAMEGSIFDSIVKESQTQPLGTEWTSIQKRLSKYMHVDKKAMELSLTPGSMTR